MGDEMTTLSNRKTRCIVQFDDSIRERGKSRPVIFQLTPYGITVRLKGMRTGFDVSPAGVYNLAVRLAVEKTRAEKKAKKEKK
jgi:hypothetical protein